MGGGLSAGLSVLATAVKELEEEAGCLLHSPTSLVTCGAVSFFNKSEDGLHPQTEFVYDLRLPQDFKPVNQDGEVDDFVLVSPQQLLDLIQSESYKTTSIPVALDWLIRHGVVNSETEDDLPDILEEIHSPLHSIYS